MPFQVARQEVQAELPAGWVVSSAVLAVPPVVRGVWMLFSEVLPVRPMVMTTLKLPSVNLIRSSVRLAAVRRAAKRPEVLPVVLVL